MAQVFFPSLPSAPYFHGSDLRQKRLPYNMPFLSANMVTFTHSLFEDVDKTYS